MCAAERSESGCPGELATLGSTMDKVAAPSRPSFAVQFEMIMSTSALVYSVEYEDQDGTYDPGSTKKKSLSAALLALGRNWMD